MYTAPVFGSVVTSTMHGKREEEKAKIEGNGAKLSFCAWPKMNYFIFYLSHQWSSPKEAPENGGVNLTVRNEVGIGEASLQAYMWEFIFIIVKPPDSTLCEVSKKRFVIILGTEIMSFR